MAGLPKSSRAYIIGDMDKGLTIVVTDPVMVAHYSAEDLKKEELKDGKANLLAGEDTSTTMAAIVRELVPILRGVNLDDVNRAAADLDAGKTDGMTQAEQRAVFTELDFAATMAQIIKAKGSVSTVDFCIGLDIDPSDIAIRWRNVSPGKDVIQYMQDSAKDGGEQPQVFAIDGLKTDGLDIPPKWAKPKV